MQIHIASFIGGCILGGVLTFVISVVATYQIMRMAENAK